MTHACHGRPCPRQICTRTAANPWKPVTTPARTPLRGMTSGRCAPSPLAGHRTPAHVRVLAQQIAEVLVGRRAPEVLNRHVTVPVREELRRLRGSVSCAVAPRLSRVFHQPLGEAGIEASAVIGCDRRSRVFAFRLRREGQRWICTRLETDHSR